MAHDYRPRRWLTAVVATLAASAAVVVAVRLAGPTWVDGLVGRRGTRPELRELIAALASEPTRPVEGRLTGGFKYAPPPPAAATRGPGEREVSPDVRIAAAKIEKMARENDTPQNHAALAVAYLSLGQPEKAVQALEDAASQERNAAVLSGWANEARTRSAQRSPSKRAEFRSHETVFAANAMPETLDSAVDRFPQAAREYVEDQLLPAWAAAIQEGRSADAERFLRVGVRLGDRLGAREGDWLARDAIALVVKATPAQLAVLSDAHLRLGRALARMHNFNSTKRLPYSRQQPPVQTWVVAVPLAGSAGIRDCQLLRP